MKRLALLAVVLVIIASSLVYLDKFKSTAKEDLEVFETLEELNITKFEVPDKIYLVVGEYSKPNIIIEERDGLDVKFNMTSSNTKVFKVLEDSIKGKSDGEAILSVKLSNGEEKKINVIVTSLISEYTFDNDKEYLGCKQYSDEEAKLLDEILEYKIKEKGYQTRSGALEAVRFLLLNFKYNLNYFSENGRLENHSNILHIDGEGRYYHKGLYLSEDKYENITDSTETGPVMWGCPLKEVVYKKIYDNGLNCSGFITWALYNAGYDIGDVGAGDYSYVDNELLDLRPKEEITNELLKSGKVKSGDLIGFDGHIAMIVGIDNDIIYVGESYETGTRIREFTHSELLKSDFTDIILMDDSYKEDGNYSEMW